MLEIEVRNAAMGYMHVGVVFPAGNERINLGLLDADERDELALTLIEAAYELGPPMLSDSDEWFRGLMTKAGICQVVES